MEGVRPLSGDGITYPEGDPAVGPAIHLVETETGQVVRREAGPASAMVACDAVVADSALVHRLVVAPHDHPRLCGACRRARVARLAENPRATFTGVLGAP